MQIILIGFLCLVAGCTPLPNTHPDILGETHPVTDTMTANVSTTGNENSDNTSGTNKGENSYEPIIYTLGTRSDDPQEMLEDYLRIQLWSYRRTHESGSGDKFNECFSIHKDNNYKESATLNNFLLQTKENIISAFIVDKKLQQCFDFDDSLGYGPISETGSQSGVFWITKNGVYQIHPDSTSHRAKVAEKDHRPLYTPKTKSNDSEELIKEYLGYYYKVPKGSVNRCFQVYKEDDFGDIDKFHFITNSHENNIKAFTTWASDIGCGDLDDGVESAKLGNFIVVGTTVYDRDRGDTMGRVILAQKK